MHRLAAAVLAVVAWESAPACTDASLQPERSTGAAALDDELRLEGEVCLSPASDAVFPVKVLLVVDTSDSMSVTDRGGVRAQAVANVMQRYAGHPGAQFGVIAFDARIDVLTDGFTNTPDIAAISGRLASADRLTDYQGALGAAYTFLSNDMAKSSPAERSRSKYVVIFFSDGTPDPQCSARETQCGTVRCPAHKHCRVNQCADDYLVCSVDKKDWATAFNPPLDPALYPELDKGADYNQPEQINRAVDDIVALQDFYHVGEVRLHTAFLFDKAASQDPLAAPFGLDRDAGVAVLSKMAEHGTGSFSEFDSADKISFLNIDYTSFKEENGLVSLIATNLNTFDTGPALAADTDGDGLIDSDEAGKTCVGLGSGCKDPADSDGDGYSDFIEERNRVSGFDPKDAKKPLLACTDRRDTDGDGLKDCEEAFLKTEPRLADSDGDRMTDRIEILSGLDPLDPLDAYDDRSRDGKRNFDKVRAHLNPTVAVPESQKRFPYLYDVAPLNKNDGRKCYAFNVRHIRLLTTGKGTDSALGVNRVLLYLDEAPINNVRDYGTFRVACVDARFIDGAVKSPASGVVRLEDTDFVSLAGFDPTRNCRDLSAGPVASLDGGTD